MFDLTVILPALNEENTIHKVINEINDSLENKKINYEILINDNNSNDDTVKIASSLKNTRINKEKKRGYGSNLRSAIQNSNSKFSIFLDADGSYDPKHIIPMYEEILKKNLDVVYLNRLKKQENKAMPFLNKYFGTPILTFFLNLIYGTKIKDCNSGMRIFKSDTFKKINFIANGMEFASEFFIEAGNRNLLIGEYVGIFRKDNRKNPPHLNRWKDGWRHLKFIISFAPMNFFHFLLMFVLFNYSLSFFLTFFKTGSGFPRFHTIILLISTNMFLQVMCVSILNFKQKFPSKILDRDKYDKFFNLFQKNIFIILFVILFLTFISLMLLMLYTWYFSTGYFINIEVALRLIIVACITSFVINIEMVLDNN